MPNDAIQTIGAETSAATLIGSDGRAEELPAMSKADLATIILDRIETLLIAPSDRSR